MTKIKYETMKPEVTINNKIYLKSYNFTGKHDCDVCDLATPKKNNDLAFSCVDMKSDCYEGFCFKRKG